MENNMLKWYGHVLCTEDNRWPKQIMTWSPDRRGGKPKMMGKGSEKSDEVEEFNT
jgi:hypothetical protein